MAGGPAEAEARLEDSDTRRRDRVDETGVERLDGLGRRRLVVSERVEDPAEDRQEVFGRIASLFSAANRPEPG